MIKLFINPGHGEPDPGAVGHGLQEAEVALEIGAKVAEFLHAAGGYDVAVYQSNNLCGEAGPYRYSVVGQANVNKFDYTISIHCNSTKNIYARGTECLVYEKGGKAHKLAQKIQSRIVSIVGTIDRGIKDRPDLAILNATHMPAVLVETAFICNKDDAELLGTRQKDFARAIALGITDYFEETGK